MTTRWPLDAARSRLVARTALVFALAGLALAATQPAVAQVPKGTLKPVGRIAGPMDMIRASGSLAFAVDSRVMTIYDISNPATPVRRGSHEFPEKVWGFRIVGPLLYVADGFSGLHILDVSNPQTPVLRAAVKNKGQSKNVSVSGERAVVANHMTGVDLFDVRDTSRPAFIGSAFLDGYARDVAIAGSVAYGVDNPSGLYIFDVAGVTSQAFDPSDSIQDAHTPQQIEISGPIAGSTFAVLGGGEPYDPARPRPPGTRPRGTLQLWDLRNPASPAAAGLYRTPGMPRHFALQGTLAYVADSEAGVHVVDLSVPTKPAAVTSFKTEKPARSIAVTGSTVLVVIGTTAEGAGGGEPNTEALILQYTP